MKITELRIQNLGIIKAVRIKTDSKGKIVVSGRNEQGKTTVLDSIAYALSGGKSFSHLVEPIRRGETKAEVVVITDTIKVTRRWTASGSTLEVTTKDGHVVKKAQEFLNGLIGNLAFDPISFSTKKKEEQYKELIELSGIDLSAFDQQYKDEYEERTSIGRNRDMENAQLAVYARNLGEDIPTTEQIKEADASLELAKANVIAMREAKKRADEAQSAVNESKNLVATYTEEIEHLLDKVEQMKQKVDSLNKVIEQSEATLANFDDSKYEEAVRAYKEAEAIVAKSAQITEYNTLSESVEKLSEQYTAKTETLAKIKEDRRTALANAPMPLDSIKITEEGDITFEGFPVEQLSAAQKLRMSIAIAMAKDPELRVCLVRDASLMDSKSMAVLDEMAEKYDFQVWMEVMDESGQKGLVIEDGEIIKEN